MYNLNANKSIELIHTKHVDCLRCCFVHSICRLNVVLFELNHWSLNGFFFFQFVPLQECLFYTLRTEEHPNNTGVACFSTQNNQVWKFWTVGVIVNTATSKHTIFVRRWCLHRRTTFMRANAKLFPYICVSTV